MYIFQLFIQKMLKCYQITLFFERWSRSPNRRLFTTETVYKDNFPNPAGRPGELDVVDSRDCAFTHENLVANGAKACLPGFDKLSFFEPLVTLLRRDPSYW